MVEFQLPMYSTGWAWADGDFATASLSAIDAGGDFLWIRLTSL